MVSASTVTMLSRTWTRETEKYFSSRRTKATDRISAKKPVRIASATDQPLHLHPFRQVGLLGFLFVADGLTRTGSSYQKGLAYLCLRGEIWRDRCSGS
ncbi:hypothetical protein ACQJBY_053607 [Aegilops geniculata]